MDDLHTEENIRIEAGKYLQCFVNAGLTHTYPDYRCILRNMESIVSRYNEKSVADPVDKLVVASCLLFDILTLHPFLDGNGSLSQCDYRYY